VAPLVEALCYKPEGRGSFPDDAIRIFYLHNPSGRALAVGFESASNRNEYQDYFLGVKVAGA
jgi:hypothetical protein